MKIRIARESLALVKKIEALTKEYDDQEVIKLALAMYWGIFVAAQDDKPTLERATAELGILATESYELLRDWREEAEKHDFKGIWKC